MKLNRTSLIEIQKYQEEGLHSLEMVHSKVICPVLKVDPPSKEQLVFLEVHQENFKFSIFLFIRLTSEVLLMIKKLNWKTFTGVK